MLVLRMEPAAWRRDAVSPLPPVFFVPFREEQKKGEGVRGEEEKSKRRNRRGERQKESKVRGGEKRELKRC